MWNESKETCTDEKRLTTWSRSSGLKPNAAAQRLVGENSRILRSDRTFSSDHFNMTSIRITAREATHRRRHDVNTPCLQNLNTVACLWTGSMFMFDPVSSSLCRTAPTESRNKLCWFRFRHPGQKKKKKQLDWFWYLNCVVTRVSMLIFRSIHDVLPRWCKVGWIETWPDIWSGTTCEQNWVRFGPLACSVNVTAVKSTITD